MELGFGVKELLMLSHIIENSIIGDILNMVKEIVSTDLIWQIRKLYFIDSVVEFVNKFYIEAVSIFSSIILLVIW